MEDRRLRGGAEVKAPVFMRAARAEVQRQRTACHGLRGWLRITATTADNRSSRGSATGMNRQGQRHLRDERRCGHESRIRRAAPKLLSAHIRRLRDGFFAATNRSSASQWCCAMK